MKKCKGCGIYLQDEDANKIGYVNNLKQDYCQRCFRLQHYGDISNFHPSYVTNEKLIEIYHKYKGYLFVVIIDILDVFALNEDNFLALFEDNDLFIIINKTDLLPDNITDKKIDNIISNILSKTNNKHIKAALLTNKYDNHFNDEFYKIIDELSSNKIVFAGRANAGKSSLINKLINENSLTTSLYPGTTLQEVEINYDKYIFIDTPGLIDEDSYNTYFNLEKYKLAKIDKTIKPKIFQLNTPQSYFYEGVLRVDFLEFDNCSISFYISNNNDIHRCKLEKANEYYENHYQDFKLRLKPLKYQEYDINNKQLFVIKGLGLIKINGKGKIRIYAYEKVRIYISEVDI